MKKTWAIVFLLSGIVLSGIIRAEWRNEVGADELFSYWTTGTNFGTSLTIPKTSGRSNCLTELTVSGLHGLQYTIIDGPLTPANTIYRVATSSGNPVFEHWDYRNPICGAMNSTTTINVQLLNGATTFNSTFWINATGYKKYR